MPRSTPLYDDRLLHQVIERLHHLHYSARTQAAYLHWIKQFVCWAGHRHPRELGRTEVEGFLHHLANDRQVATTTHRQAANALLFLYHEVLGLQLPWLEVVGRPHVPRRTPPVLTPSEVQRLLLHIGDAQMRRLAALLYGTGMRLAESLRLRVKDLDFERRLIAVRDGTGRRVRTVEMPISLDSVLRQQLHASHALWAADRAQQAASVKPPEPVASSQLDTASTWTWHWVFPSCTHRVDPLNGVQRRLPADEKRLQGELKTAAKRAGISRPLNADVLRRAYAAHRLSSSTGVHASQGVSGPADPTAAVADLQQHQPAGMQPDPALEMSSPEEASLPVQPERSALSAYRRRSAHEEQDDTPGDLPDGAPWRVREPTPDYRQPKPVHKRRPLPPVGSGQRMAA